MIKTVEYDPKHKTWWTVNEEGERVKAYSTKRHALNAYVEAMKRHASD